MKKLIMTATVTAIVALAGGKAAAQTPEGVAGPDRLSVRVTGIVEKHGTVMVALGDHKDPSGMLSAILPADGARDGAVECTFVGEIDPAATLYVFLDANGNYDLDRGERGIPLEKCAYGPVVIDENGTATIELKYYNN